MNKKQLWNSAERILGIETDCRLAFLEKHPLDMRSDKDFGVRRDVGERCWGHLWKFCRFLEVNAIISLGITY